MKTTTLCLILFLAALGLQAQMPPTANTNAQAILRQIMARRHGLTNGTPAMPGFPALGNGSRGPLGALPPGQAPGPNFPNQPVQPQPQNQPLAQNNFPGLPSPNNPPGEETVPPGFINFQGVDVNQVLEVYAQLVGRTLLRASLPQASIVLKTQTALTKKEAIEALEAVLALNNISVINVGDKFVKVEQSDQANTAAAELDRGDAANLPELGSYVTHIVQLKFIKPSEMVPIIQPFAKLQNSILPIDSNGILVLRDYAENVKRMLEMIDQIDVSVPAEYVSEVIPIKYAQAEDIASALNSLGGQGGSTVSFGSSGSSSQISGLRGGSSSGINGMGSTGGFGGTGGTGTSGIGGSTGYGGQNQRAFGSASTANGTPNTGSSFQQRLQSIINKASGGGQQDQIQVFGQAKIIADSRANALLVFATRQDMISIKHVINQLDVLLSQVLIEAVIMDYSLGPNTFTFGLSAAQNPHTFSGNSTNGITGGGGIVNGPSFLNLASGSFGTNAAGTLFGNSLASGGLSYFGNIGQSWDLALQAASSDSHASIIQRPRIQTSQAKPAQFFVGETVPYVTSTYNYGGINGNQSSYSQLSVGVELDVTPFINPDGLVVMDIQQEIDDLDGTTTISGVGDVPNTIKRTLNTEIAVKDRDTVMLGGFIKNQKSTSRAGVPFLEDIPLLGNLFASRNDSKQREELLVLMRPTVLQTPEIAAKNTIIEEQRLPGISAAAAEDAAEYRKLVNDQRKSEQSRAKTSGENDGFYTAPAEGAAPQTTNSGDDGSHDSGSSNGNGYFDNTASTNAWTLPPQSMPLK
jgi:general secretion pathway protein D